MNNKTFVLETKDIINDNNNSKEAERCLQCKKPRCSTYCPVETPIPEMIDLYKNEDIYKAGKFLFENNPLSALTASLCDHESFCKGHCVFNRKGEPIKWHNIEQEISLKYLNSDRIFNDFFPALPNYCDINNRVAIIGAGPAGIVAALMLRREGVSVSLYDINPEIGGVLRYGIPNFRLDKKILESYTNLIEKSDINFVGNTKIIGQNQNIESKTNKEEGKGEEKINKEEEGRKEIKKVPISKLMEKHKAILIATGAEKPRHLNIPGENNNNIIYALDYLKTPDSYKLGNTVLVIGGGNVAMDAARTVLRQGIKPIVCYRKSFSEMPANMDEIIMARKEGIEFRLFETPIEIKNKNTAIMISCKNIEKDGRIATEFIDGSEHELHFDNMIIAISEVVDFDILSGLKNLKEENQTEDKERDIYKEIKKKNENIFFAGDFILGPKTIVHAVESAKKTTNEIIAFLNK